MNSKLPDGASSFAKPILRAAQQRDADESAHLQLPSTVLDRELAFVGLAVRRIEY